MRIASFVSIKYGKVSNTAASNSGLKPSSGIAGTRGACYPAQLIFNLFSFSVEIGSRYVAQGGWTQTPGSNDPPTAASSSWDYKHMLLCVGRQYFKKNMLQHMNEPIRHAW